MKKLIVAIMLITSSVAFATSYTLDCHNPIDQDAFSVEIDTVQSHIHFIERNQFSITVDDYFYPAILSTNLQIIDAGITTYDYFIGEIKFFLGKGLVGKEIGESFNIALSANDGDGFAFDKKSFCCKLTDKSRPLL